MSSCAASRVIYFLLFHNPFHNHNVHTSATPISLLAPPTSSSPAHTCTHLHSTQPLLRSDFPSPSPQPQR
ncbi:hypothetical protein C362_06791 [Cryptococcus neoformans Bt1]|nr:hypothetical protein C362_06791 [Cryptococcus neoformans var. grubii Bt1]